MIPRIERTLARYRNHADLQEMLMPKPAQELVHTYVTEAGHPVMLCPHCASSMDHGKGGLAHPLGTLPIEGPCAGAMHAGMPGSALYTEIDQIKLRLSWWKTHGRTFTPWQVCSGINRGLADGIGQEVLKAGGDL